MRSRCACDADFHSADQRSRRNRLAHGTRRTASRLPSWCPNDAGRTAGATCDSAGSGVRRPLEAVGCPCLIVSGHVDRGGQATDLGIMYLERRGTPARPDEHSKLSAFECFGVAHYGTVGAMPLLDVTDVVEQFILALRREGCAQSTLNKYITVTKALFTWAAKKRLRGRGA
jgi:hypothetical protein